MRICKTDHVEVVQGDWFLTDDGDLLDRHPARHWSNAVVTPLWGKVRLGHGDPWEREVHFELIPHDQEEPLLRFRLAGAPRIERSA